MYNAKDTLSRELVQGHLWSWYVPRKAMKSVIALPVLLLVCLGANGTAGWMGSSRCSIRCGVVGDNRGQVRLVDYVASVWNHMKINKSITDIDMTFVHIRTRTEMTQEDIREAYMDIGTANVSALLGDFSPVIAIGSKTFGVPYFTISGEIVCDSVPPTVLSARPSSMDIHRIAGDVVEKYRWTEVAVIYEGAAGVYLIEELVGKPDVHVRALRVDRGLPKERLTTFLLQLRQLSVTQIIVMASWATTESLLQVALRLSMLSLRYSWMIATLSPQDTAMLDYSDTQVNLTAFHLAEPRVGVESYHLHFTTYEYAAIYDSLLTLYRGIMIHHLAMRNCQWVGQDRLKSTLAQVHDRGATGDLRFDSNGRRMGYVVKVLGLTTDGLRQIGIWNSSMSDSDSRLTINYSTPTKISHVKYPLGGAIVQVATVLEPPFVQLKFDHALRSGNDRFEGFCIDLLKEIAKKISFKYELYLVPDEEFGQEISEGNWSGLVGEIINGRADLAMASLTMTTKREEVIDFTIPFKTRSISIITRKPPPDSTLFQFTAPLSPFVWLLLGVVLVFVSLTLYVVDRLSPPKDSKSKLGGPECVWFVFASMVLSGTSINPKTISGRLLAAALSFFSLIIISSYTANLAAFLTISKFHTNIRTVADLLNQHEIEYGTVKGSEIGDYFHNSDLTLYKEMWHTMTTLNPKSMVTSSEEGFSLVKKSEIPYAFLYDSPVIRHKVNTECDLMEVGKPFDSRGYSVGVPIKAGYREDLTMAILELGDEGTISFLETKWWNSTKCPNLDVVVTSKTTSLTVHKVGGVFMVLAGSIVLALIACVIDHYYHYWRLKSTMPKNRRVCETNSMDPKDDHSTQAEVPRQTVEEPFLKNQAPIIPRQTNIF